MRISKKSKLAEWLAREQPSCVGPGEFAALREMLAPVSESYLRHLLRDSGAPLDPLVEGVRQEDYDSLERSLTALAEVYDSAGHHSEMQRETRKLVIEAKEHARFALKRLSADPTQSSTRAQKQEMIQWMITWLENPGIFAQWVTIRRLAMQREAGARGEVLQDDVVPEGFV